MECLTFHGIDDAVQIDASEWMLRFTQAFAFPLLLANLSEGARECRFIINDHTKGEAYFARAKRIIACLRMPLEPILKVDKVGGLTYQTRLIVKYTGQ